MISHEIPSRPLEKVGCDLLGFEDKHYLVCVDYVSDYFEVDRIFGKKGKEVISRLKSQFARHGIPDQFISDNGPPFSSREFQDFHWPMSLSTSQRSTLTEGIESSPAQQLFGRRTETLVPTSTRLLVPEAVHRVPNKLKERKVKQTYYHDRAAKEFDRLKPGNVACVKLRPDSREWTKATVDKEVDIRSYQIRTEDGRTYRRHHRHLRHTMEPFLTAPFMEFSTNLSQLQQQKGVVPSGNFSVSEATTRKPASKVSTRELASGAPNRKPVSEAATSSSVIHSRSHSVFDKLDPVAYFQSLLLEFLPVSQLSLLPPLEVAE
ncbi:uncharacterized protein LOC111345777 [Stylophora pistillata]|uniref:uncharacterized protein LOC111345777 n=1 Tax=Stylophora pistillata TaxID=50429 RepID=UPI000C056AE2|nr:uncharacterized protein LOC111345777 [Stylophora pistillata]